MMASERYNDAFASVQPEAKEKLQGVPDVIPPTLAERMIAAIEKQYGPLPLEPPVNGYTIRCDCRFCHGRGCLNCDTLADAEYKRQFPDGPKPILTFHRAQPGAPGLIRTILETDVVTRVSQGELTSAQALVLVEETERCAMWDAVGARAPQAPADETGRVAL